MKKRKTRLRLYCGQENKESKEDHGQEDERPSKRGHSPRQEVEGMCS